MVVVNVVTVAVFTVVVNVVNVVVNVVVVIFMVVVGHLHGLATLLDNATKKILVLV